MAMTRKQAESRITKLYGDKKYFNCTQTAIILDKTKSLVSLLKKRNKIEYIERLKAYPREAIVQRMITEQKSGRQKGE